LEQQDNNSQPVHSTSRFGSASTVRDDAIVASAFNNLAATDTAMQSQYPCGMRPMDAASLPTAVRIDLMQRWGGSDGLYSPADVQAAIAREAA
jgi:hypothetical protein